MHKTLRYPWRRKGGCFSFANDYHCFVKLITSQQGVQVAFRGLRIVSKLNNNCNITIQKITVEIVISCFLCFKSR